MFKSKLSHFKKQGITLKVITLVFLLLSAHLQLSAQNEKVILSVRESTVKQFFDEIQRQTEYKIAIDWNNLKPQARVMVSSNIITVKDLLIQLLQNTGYTYKLNNKYIIITPTSAEDPFPPVSVTSEAPRQNILGKPARSSSIYAPVAGGKMKEVADPYKKPKMVVKNDYWETEIDSTGSVKAFMLYFRVNSSLLERTYKDNARTLNILDAIFSDRESLRNMDFVTINAAASPEGDLENNERLAQNRALAIKSYIMWKFPYLDRDGITTYSVGEDWTGLKKMIEDNTFVPGREELLDILDDEYIDSELKKTYLKRVNNGASYRYIEQNLYPYLRGGATCMIFYKDPNKVAKSSDFGGESSFVSRIDTVYMKEQVLVRDTMCVEMTEVVLRDTVPNKFYMAVKNNIIYDALLLPNLAVEFYIPGRWSIEAEGIWSWWRFNSFEKYNRIQSAGLEVRKWFGKKYENDPLCGHHIGLYGMYGTYDVKLGKNEFGSLSNSSFSVGLSYGYSVPVAKRLNLEFGIAFGYMGGEYEKYSYSDYWNDHPWNSTHKRHYFGPTKAKASLVWQIGSGINKSKVRSK